MHENLSPTRRQMMVATVVGLGCLTLHADDGISHASDSIHQETDFNSDPKRIFDALTDSAQFHKIMLLGEAMRSGKVPDTHPTQISREPGSAFTLFGGFITGRQIELVPNLRIVQAWREIPWDAGVYSIARFELKPAPSGTRLVFDHTGFPPGAAPHLAVGWKDNYWLPLAKYLS